MSSCLASLIRFFAWTDSVSHGLTSFFCWCPLPKPPSEAASVATRRARAGFAPPLATPQDEGDGRMFFARLPGCGCGASITNLTGAVGSEGVAMVTVGVSDIGDGGDEEEGEDDEEVE